MSGKRPDMPRALAAYDGAVRVNASPEALELVRERGGRVFVHARRHRCCGGSLTTLETAVEPGTRTFERYECDGIVVYLDDRLAPPAELELVASGRRRRVVRAYWNGCAYIF